MNLKIILSSDNSPIMAALKALIQALPTNATELYCLCANEAEFMQIKTECENIKKGNVIQAFRIFTFHDFDSVPKLANHHFLNSDSSCYLLFLSSDVLLEKRSLKRMIDYLSSDSHIAGANPFLLADWCQGSEERIAFMGLAFDFQKQLHYLYEGIRTANTLTEKTRFFQIAHPGCLLLQCTDFRQAGGFKDDLGFLAFPALCLQILHLKSRGYVCVREARGRLLYKFDSWSLCGAWNSILQRGRLETSNVNADYANFCQDDGLDYGLDSWLGEGPAPIPDLSDSPPEKYWQEWRYHPKPATLIRFLSSLPAEERPLGVELARNRPASLPQTLQYYKIQAKKIKALAKERGLPIEKQVDFWQTKIRRFHYGELKPGIELLKKAGIYNCSLDTCPAIFDAWVEISEKFDRLDISGAWPTIGVVMPVWNPKPDFLIQAIDSVLRQSYPNWQLCIADDASTKSEIRPILENFANGHERIRVRFREKNGHICRASNTALEMVDAPFTAFLDHDDLLSPHALGEVARRIAQKPDLGFIYSDDDRINEYNVRRTPVFKPDFDCDLFYTGHLSTYDTKLIQKIGGLRVGTEGSQDQDLRLRATELLDNGRIVHIPRILYHWRVHEESTASSFLAKPYMIESTRKVYLDAAARQGRNAAWGDKTSRKLFRLLYYPQKRGLCSIIFLINGAEPSGRLLETINGLTKYVEIEVYAQPLRKDSPLPKFCPSLPYVGREIARACNKSAAKVNGDVLLFLSADLEPDRECRLEQLVEMVMLPHIAMASGNIWRAEKLVNGGWYPDADGLPFPLLQGMNRSRVKNSVWGHMCLPRHVIGVPWQCMAVKKEFCQKNRFLDETYGSYATVDFAIRAMSKNKFVAMNPWVNWQTDIMPVFPTEAEMQFMLDRRGGEIAACGLRNPNLRAAMDRDWTIIL